MITLFTFGPYFGLPDGSPFVVKAMLLLKLAGLEYSEDRGGFGKAPKSKLPYINDGGLIVADSTFIRFHIENKYGFDFDAGLTPEQRAAAWAIEKMCEEQLYFAVLATRWLDDANFVKGPAQFLKAVPTPFRPIVLRLVARKVKKTLKLQGFLRHTQAERDALARLPTSTRLPPLSGRRLFCWAKSPAGRMLRSSPSSRVSLRQCSTRRSVQRRSATPISPSTATGSCGVISKARASLGSLAFFFA
jgi:Glutathione S-transferase N-terminal domain